MSTKKKTAKKANTSKTNKKAAKKPAAAPAQVAGTLRLPKTGEKITRTYHGTEHVIEVVEGGFQYKDQDYTSLTALAKKITGYKAISGPAFFGLWKREEAK